MKKILVPVKRVPDWQIKVKVASDGKSIEQSNLKWIINTFDEIANAYVEMNIAHPFMEGNGRSTRIWLDLILKKQLNKCVDWSKIAKNDYHQAMVKSVINSDDIKNLIKNALTDEINSREMYMKGIDYSYYYEEN